LADTRYNPYDIDDPFTYRAIDGFISIGNLRANDDGTVYLQGHLVIPNPWGNVSINKTDTATTNYTTDITDKSAGGMYDFCCNLYTIVDQYYREYKWCGTPDL
jgi:hypothetical protein